MTIQGQKMKRMLQDSKGFMTHPKDVYAEALIQLDNISHQYLFGMERLFRTIYEEVLE